MTLAADFAGKASQIVNGGITQPGFTAGNSIYAGAGPGGANTSSTGGTETRPRNRAWNWFIKL